MQYFNYLKYIKEGILITAMTRKLADIYSKPAYGKVSC